MEHEAVRIERAGEFGDAADFPDHRPRAFPRIEIGVRGEMHVQGRALSGNDPADFDDFAGCGEIFVALARFHQQKRHIITPFRCKPHGGHIGFVQQERGRAEAHIRDHVFPHQVVSLPWFHTQHTMMTAHSVSSTRHPNTSPVTPPSRFFAAESRKYAASRAMARA